MELPVINRQVIESLLNPIHVPGFPEEEKQRVIGILAARMGKTPGTDLSVPHKSRAQIKQRRSLSPLLFLLYRLIQTAIALIAAELAAILVALPVIPASVPVAIVRRAVGAVTIAAPFLVSGAVSQANNCQHRCQQGEKSRLIPGRRRRLLVPWGVYSHSPASSAKAS